MSASEAADDCPLCLEPLPPYWDRGRRVIQSCCGKDICVDCHDNQVAFVDRAIATGTFGRQEKQIGGFCPLCRTKLPKDDDEVVAMMLDQLEKGTLPLSLYHNLGTRYRIGQPTKDVEKGLEILMLGAEKGDPNCQLSIGGAYVAGEGSLEKSPAEAKRWFVAATEQGHAEAEYHLALLFRDEGNDTEFLQHLIMSASKGFGDACYNLGLAYARGGYGLEQSFKEAISVVTPAAEKGHTKSMELLGLIMCGQDPELGPREKPCFTEGLHWARRAAETGDEEAISSLGDLEKLASSKCFRCNKPAPPEKAFLRCSRCRAAWYCSKDCQVQHWKAEGGHKQCCIKW